MVVIASALAFVAVAFYIASAYTSDSVKISQSEDAVQRIAAAVDYVYALGPNSREFVTVYMPQDLESANISGKRVIFKVRTNAGTTDIFANTKADLVGALPEYRGKQKILVEYMQNGKVRVGEAGLYCSPPIVTHAFTTGGEATDTVTISNTGDFNITGINYTLSGAITSIATVVQAPSSVLATGQNTTARVKFAIPQDMGPGVYGGTLEIGSGNDGSCATAFTIYINGVSSCSSLCASQGYITGSCRASPGSCMNGSEDYVSAYNVGCTNVSLPSCCCYPSSDTLGPLATLLSSSPANASNAQNVTINATCNDTTTGGSFIRDAEVQVDGGVWNAANAADGTFSHMTAEPVTKNIGTLQGGQHIAAVRCTDTANNTGPISYLYFNITASDLLGPIITMMNHTDFPTTLTNVTECGSATEVYTGGANVAACYLKLDSGAWFATTPNDGSYNSVTEGFCSNMGTLSSGLHTVYGYCVDSLNNVGGIYNDTFGVVSVDVVLVMDVSGSMDEPVTNIINNTAVSTSSASYVLSKTITVASKNGNYANVTTEITGSTTGCTAAYELRVGGVPIANGSYTGKTYTNVYNNNVDISAYSAPFNVDLYLKRGATSCTASQRNFNLVQYPSKMNAAKSAAKSFVDVVGTSTQAGLASYSTSSTLNSQLKLMGTSNKTALKNSIDALTAGGNTCIGCGINTAVAELTSARSKYPNSTRVIVLLTDGQNNVNPPDPLDSAVSARESHVIIYTIGFGDSVDEVQLTNIALLTLGQYYFAPDAATLEYIYSHIGQNS